MGASVTTGSNRGRARSTKRKNTRHATPVSTKATLRPCSSSPRNHVPAPGPIPAGPRQTSHAAHAASTPLLSWLNVICWLGLLAAMVRRPRRLGSHNSFQPRGSGACARLYAMPVAFHM